MEALETFTPNIMIFLNSLYSNMLPIFSKEDVMRVLDKDMKQRRGQVSPKVSVQCLIELSVLNMTLNKLILAKEDICWTYEMI